MQDSDPQTFNWLPYSPSGSRPIDIKVEPSALESQAFSLLSPPSSPSFSRSVRTQPTSLSSSSTSSRRRSNVSSFTSPKRPKPYPSSSSESRPRADDSGKMSNPPYGSWSSGGKSGNSRYGTERRSVDGDQRTPSYSSFSNSFVPPHSFSRSTYDRESRAHSSDSSTTTSSLTGAMGDTHVSSQFRHSHSSSPPEQSYQMNMNSGMVWSPSQSQPTHPQPLSGSNPHSYSAVPGQGDNMPFHALSGSTGPYVPYSEYNTSTHNNPSPESVSPNSPAFPSYGDQSTFTNSRTPSLRPNVPAMQVQQSGSMYGSPLQSTPSQRPRAGLSSQEAYAELSRLNKRIRELELINNSGSQRVRELEAELAHGTPYSSHGSSSSAIGGLPSPLATPSPQSGPPQASWRARTDARVRLFCSLNRAGNALCAWHDSRRERRAYPPRMAPPGHLNCGCTFEEALFEESLSRHKVGSYHPGDSVRMDPALRNPLLKLLQRRYGYKDGDFERDPITGNWIEGEGHAPWEAKAVAGIQNPRKPKSDDRR